MRYFVSNGQEILGEVTEFRSGHPPQWVPESRHNPDARVSFVCPPIAKTGEGGELVIVSEEGKGWWIMAEDFSFGTSRPFELQARYRGEIVDKPEGMAAVRQVVANYLKTEAPRGPKLHLFIGGSRHGEHVRIHPDSVVAGLPARLRSDAPAATRPTEVFWPRKFVHEGKEHTVFIHDSLTTDEGLAWLNDDSFDYSLP